MEKYLTRNECPFCHQKISIENINYRRTRVKFECQNPTCLAVFYVYKSTRHIACIQKPINNCADGFMVINSTEIDCQPNGMWCDDLCSRIEFDSGIPLSPGTANQKLIEEIQGMGTRTPQYPEIFFSFREKK